MAWKNLVLRSINSVDGLRCVDIFQREDGGVGFARFRRDPDGCLVEVASYDPADRVAD